jgi:hypothetical protein
MVDCFRNKKFDYTRRSAKSVALVSHDFYVWLGLYKNIAMMTNKFH